MTELQRTDFNTIVTPDDELVLAADWLMIVCNDCHWYKTGDDAEELYTSAIAHRDLHYHGMSAMYEDSVRIKP